MEVTAASYKDMFDKMIINPDKIQQVEATAKMILTNKSRYQAVAFQCGAVPWYVVGVIHYRECDLRFDEHLSNGDPLTGRTVNDPKGQPVTPDPPYTWEQGALIALRQADLDKVNDWPLHRILFRLELYNGFGPRNEGINTGYLWSFTNWYSAGKFSSDDDWDPSEVDQQCGCAPIIKYLIDTAQIN